jgi:cyclophilin family peptidyl-prolyl cis-trans isomerase
MFSIAITSKTQYTTRAVIPVPPPPPAPGLPPPPPPPVAPVMNPFYLNYKNTRFFRIVKNLGIYGGDNIKDDGTSGESIYGMVFRDENFNVMHDSRYLLTATKPVNTPHTNNSQFMITLAPLPWLDYRYQVFGRVRSTSRSVIDYMEFFAGTTDWDKKEEPFYEIRIKQCSLTQIT